MKKHLKSMKYALFTAIFVGFTAIAPAKADFEKVSFVPHSIKKQEKTALKYNVYAGGFKALNATIEMDLDKKAYDMNLEARTQGFIGKLFPWKASMNTSGHTEKGEFIPILHTERSTWRKTEKTSEMSYSPDGTILKSTSQSHGQTTVNRDIDQNIAAQSVDVLTSVLAMFKNAENTKKCGGTFPVFDGKRHFNIVLKDQGTEIIAPSRYSRFSGEAFSCTLKVEPVAGFKKKDKKRGWLAVQNHTEKRNKLPTLWFASLKDTNQIVPVRMEISSSYGAVVAHLAK